MEGEYCESLEDKSNYIASDPVCFFRLLTGITFFMLNNECADSLPICKAREKILKAIRDNHVTILIGETGSGKTTQIPQYIVDSNFLSKLCQQSQRTPSYETGTRRMVGITQPRRVAAISIAEYVARERKSADVGYTVRFNDSCTEKTRIKYMTDGILVREIYSDPVLSRYGVIILDEAHERSIYGDVLFCMLKNILLDTDRFYDLKVVIMSAAMEIDHFAAFWRKNVGISHKSHRKLRVGSAYLRGRQHPVTIKYITAPISNYVRASVEVSMQIIVAEANKINSTADSFQHAAANNRGNVLIFLTGHQEIEEAFQILCYKRSLIKNHGKRYFDFIPLKLYGGMSKEEQASVVSPSPKSEFSHIRKVIVSSNIAETSLTIPGVSFVIDCGFVKQKWYNTTHHSDELRVVSICKAQAIQRAGRSGREGPGTCYRLYTEDCFWNCMESFPRPEMMRCCPLSVLLHLKSIGIHNVCSFDFIDPPNPHALTRALENLYLLSAVDLRGKVSRIGKIMAQLPLEPMAARTLVRAIQTDCQKSIEMVVTILSVLSSEGIFNDNAYSDSGVDNRSHLPQKHSSEGDLFLYYDLLSHFRKLPVEERRTWCRSQCVHFSEMNKALKIRIQLLKEIEKLEPGRCFNTFGGIDDIYKNVRVSFSAGYFSQVAMWNSAQRAYVHVGTGNHVYISPASVLIGSKVPHSLILFGSLLFTTKNYMRDLLVITEESLESAFAERC